MPDAADHDLINLAFQRAQRVTGYMTAHQLDLLLLQTFDNLRYAVDYRSLIITEFTDLSLALVSPDGRADLYIPFVREPADNDTATLPLVRSFHPLPSWVPLMTEPRTVISQVADGIRRSKPRRVGYDAVHPMLLDGIRAQFDDIEFIYVGNDLFDLRRSKLAAEITLLTRAAADNFKALSSVTKVAHPGVTDRELMGHILHEQMTTEAETISHGCCNFGADFGNWFAVGQTFEPGKGIFFDQVYYGRGGYASDLARTYFLGEPSRELEAGYRGLIDAIETVYATAQAGSSVSGLDALLNRELSRRGLPTAPYSIGHGVGLRVVEPPAITDRKMVDEDRRLIEGEVIAFEPETYVVVDDKKVLLKVEDTFLVEANGIRPLTATATFDESIIPL